MTIAVFLQKAYMKSSVTTRPIQSFKTFFGASMTGEVADFVVRRICFFGFFEPSLTNFMMKTIKKADTVVDIGANVGYFTLLMSKLASNGVVISIEASPTTFSYLRQNVDVNKASNVRLVEIAVADRKGQVSLVDELPQNAGSRTIVGARTKSQGVVVQSDTLLSIIEKDISSISFIKIDIEGAERAPMLEILANKDRFPKPFTIVSEISNDNRDLLQMFADQGFSVGTLANDYTWKGYLDAKSFDGSVRTLSERKFVTDDYVFKLD